MARKEKNLSSDKGVKRKKKIIKEKEVKKVKRYDEKPMIIRDEENQSQTSMANSIERDTEATKVLEKLAKPDSIMDTTVMNAINEFLRSYTGTNGPEILVQKLSSSYRGHAQMIGLLGSWLDSLLVEKPKIDSKSAFESTESSANTSKSPSWMYTEDILYGKLQELIIQHYNPKLVCLNVLRQSQCRILKSSINSRCHMC